MEEARLSSYSYKVYDFIHQATRLGPLRHYSRDSPAARPLGPSDWGLWACLAIMGFQEQMRTREKKRAPGTSCVGGDLPGGLMEGLGRCQA
jgi:hypothetical protein